ncbi:MAG: type II toxin-antitoxin system RelE/ParE family toxin [bacterium]|nr:type II toxin-antitoxin system RelE/ParE family toxin [bacterium]
MWKIELSRNADKFAKEEKIEDARILLFINKFINYSKGLDENIDVKKMKGKWKGYYRIKIGKIRMILKPEFKEQKVFVDRIDYRGSVYK